MVWRAYPWVKDTSPIRWVVPYVILCLLFNFYISKLGPLIWNKNSCDMLLLIGWDNSQYNPMGKFAWGDEVSTIGHKVDMPKSNTTIILTHVFYWYVVMMWMAMDVVLLSMYFGWWWRMDGWIDGWVGGHNLLHHFALEACMHHGSPSSQHN